jgi:hypothetical protein
MPSSILGNELALRFGRQRWLIGVMLASALLAIVVGLGAACARKRAPPARALRQPDHGFGHSVVPLARCART